MGSVCAHAVPSRTQHSHQHSVVPLCVQQQRISPAPINTCINRGQTQRVSALVADKAAESNSTVGTQPRPLKVLIAGAGIGGLVLAVALMKQGVDVAVFERDLTAIRGEGKYRGPIQVRQHIRRLRQHIRRLLGLISVTMAISTLLITAYIFNSTAAVWLLLLGGTWRHMGVASLAMQAYLQHSASSSNHALKNLGSLVPSSVPRLSNARNPDVMCSLTGQGSHLCCVDVGWPLEGSSNTVLRI